MTIVHAEIQLVNGNDLALQRKNIILDEREIKRINVTAAIGTGSLMLCINENIQEQLQLPIVEKRKAKLANGEIIECDVVAPIEIRFKNRATTCSAMVLPENYAVQLGSIPLQDLDVVIDPIKQELIVNPAHPDCVQMRLHKRSLL